jgi:hypothetical protein
MQADTARMHSRQGTSMDCEAQVGMTLVLGVGRAAVKLLAEKSG